MSKILVVLSMYFLLVSFGCLRKESRPRADVLPEQEMILFLIDMHTVDAMLHTEKGLPEEKKDKSLYYYPSLLEKYGITRAQADSSFFYYSNRPKKFARMYETVLSELEKRQIKDPVKDSADTY